MTIVVSAPGKLVVTGEYAVLAGAPALVMAINRRMVCTLQPADSVDWHFRSSGFAGEAHHTLTALLDGGPLDVADPAYLCQHILRALRAANAGVADLPSHLLLSADSRAGFDGAQKIGVGSSAAVCAASTAALLRLCGSAAPVVDIAQRAHAHAQGGRGSGLDVAAACAGGFICFERTRDTAARQLSFPENVRFATVFTGTSAATTDHLARYDRWCAGAIPQPLQNLMDAASAVAAAVPEAEAFMRQLCAYIRALQQLDDAADLGIYTDAHRKLTRLGTACGVAYKPSGAGGGDMGMAFATDAAAIASFEAEAATAGFKPLPMELDLHGITISHEG